MSKAKKNGESFEKIDQLRMFLNWIVEQSGDTPIKYIKDLAKEQFTHLDEIESKHSLEFQLIENQKTKIIDDLRKENQQLSEKMTEGVQDVINSLQSKIMDLNNELSKSFKNLEIIKVVFIQEENGLLNHKISQLNQIIIIKEQEVSEYRSSNSILDDQIQEYKQKIEELKLLKYFPVEESENTEKAFEKLLVQVKDLEEENFRIKKMNQILEFEVQNLQKANFSEFFKPKTQAKPKNFFNSKNNSTQTLEEPEKFRDWIQITSCMASAIEDILITKF